MSEPTSAPLFGQTAQQVQSQQAQQPQTLEDTLIAQREKWTAEVTSLNEMMKTLPKLDGLLTMIYTRRQECVDYYTAMNSIIIKQNAEYKKRFNNMFNNIRVNGLNGLRIGTDAAIGKCVEAELSETKMQIEILVNHNNFIKSTIETIDNMIYGINQKIKLAEMLNGMKF